MIDEIYHNNVRYLGNLLGEIIREQEMRRLILLKMLEG